MSLFHCHSSGLLCGLLEEHPWYAASEVKEPLKTIHKNKNIRTYFLCQASHYKSWKISVSICVFSSSLQSNFTDTEMFSWQKTQRELLPQQLFSSPLSTSDINVVEKLLPFDIRTTRIRQHGFISKVTGTPNRNLSLN